MTEEDDRVKSGPSGMTDAILRGVAYALYLVAAVLLGVLLFWAYRMVAVGGSVSEAVRRAVFLGWPAAAFVTGLMVGCAVCVFAATSLLNAGRGPD